MSIRPETSHAVAEPEHMGRVVRRQVMDGSLRILIAEGLILPTGLITAAFLTRHLGPAKYGLFTLASIVILWMEFFVTSLFSRATVKLIGDAENWHSWGATLVRLYLLAGVAAALLIWLSSRELGQLLGEPAMARCLRLFALDIPIFCLASAHRDILVGLRHYRERARASATRWLTRLILIVALVWAGLSVTGAILAIIGASLLDFAVARYYIRPPLWGRFPLHFERLWKYALPLFVAGVTLRVFDKLDLFVLKALGATSALAGLYGAAQNLTIVPGLIGAAFAPVLLAALTHTIRGGEHELAREVAGDAVRISFVLLPFAALVAGASPAITTLVLGKAFVPAAPFLAVLIFSGFARLLVSVSIAILIAAEHPRWVLVLTGPVVPLVLVAYLLVIPYAGPRGASLATTAVSVLLAIACLAAVYMAWGVKPSPATLARTALVSLGTYVGALVWPASGAMLVFKLGVIGALVLAAYFATGEFGGGEIALLRSVVWPEVAGPAAPLPGLTAADKLSRSRSRSVFGTEY